MLISTDLKYQIEKIKWWWLLGLSDGAESGGSWVERGTESSRVALP